MSLDDYPEPKGAYYTPALQAQFAGEAAAEAAIAALRNAGFGTRDIYVLRENDTVTTVVSEPTPGMLEKAQGILTASGAFEVKPYGSGGLDPSGGSS